MLNNIFNKINLFSRISFRFDLPIKTKILLYDEIHAHILRETIKRDFNILYLRKKKIYFWIYFKQIIFFDFTFKTYSKNFIKFISPKVIITFNDARFDMYELKKDFKDISFISVMNGIRFEKWFKDRKKLWPKNIKIFYGDYFFTLNDYYITHYQKLLKSDYRSLGHFRNNLVNIRKDDEEYLKKVIEITGPSGFTEIVEQNMSEKIKVLPSDFFCCKSWNGAVPRTRNSYIQHHFTGSWH